MSENTSGSMPELQDVSAEPSGFVPATYHPGSKNAGNPAVGQPVVNGTYAQYSRTNSHYKSGGSTSGGSRGKKAAVIIIILALAAAVAGLGFYVYKESQKETVNADLHQLAAEELKAVDEQLTGATAFDEPFTVLLLGSDARADDPDMGARTDTIILVRVDPTINKVSMVSIPRDTRIEIEGQGIQKFNAAYTFGGPSGTIAAVKDLTGVDIDHYAEINFEGLVGLVDAIGGIDVVVDEVIDDEDAGGHIDEGEQHLDGEHALILARSRAYVDGDYTRQVNQRKVIMAIINKALTAPATELSGLIKASTKFLKTDSGIDFDFIYDLADQIRHNNDYPVEIYTATIPSTTATIDGVSYVIADTAGVKALMKRFKAGKDVSKGVTESSINEDVADAMAGSTGEDTYYGDVGTFTEDAQYGYDMEIDTQSYYDPDAGADAPIDYNVSPELYEEGYAEGEAAGGEGGDGSYEGEYVEEGETYYE